MKIAVLGATGATGIRFVKEALALGHDVVAVVRNPDKLKDVKDERLKVSFSVLRQPTSYCTSLRLFRLLLEIFSLKRV